MGNAECITQVWIVKLLYLVEVEERVLPGVAGDWLYVRRNSSGEGDFLECNCR